jgi:hypothetical protein
MRTVVLASSILAVVVTGITAAAVAQSQKPNDNVRVLSGSDLGFRVERMEGSRAVGTFVVKVEDKWVEVTLSPKAVHIR